VPLGPVTGNAFQLSDPVEKSSQKYKPVAAAHPTNAGAELDELLSLELLWLELLSLLLWLELLSLLLWLELTLELIELLSLELLELEMLEDTELETVDDEDNRLDTATEDTDEETEDDELLGLLLLPPPQAVSIPANNKIEIS
jgi:hypothetical protein